MSNFRIRYNLSLISPVNDAVNMIAYDLLFILAILTDSRYSFSPSYITSFLIFLYNVYPYRLVGMFHIFYNINYPLINDPITWIGNFFTALVKFSMAIFAQPLTPQEWGPSYWKFLFNVVHNYDKTMHDLIVNFLTRTLPYLLPCPKCQADYLTYIVSNPIGPDTATWLQTLRESIRARNLMLNTPVPVFDTVKLKTQSLIFRVEPLLAELHALNPPEPRRRCCGRTN